MAGKRLTQAKNSIYWKTLVNWRVGFGHIEKNNGKKSY